MNAKPKNKFDLALTLKAIITTHATDGIMDDDEFRRLRDTFFNDPSTKRLLPQFIRNNIDGAGVWTYLKDYHTGNGAYAARRKHLTSEFQPLLDYLSDLGAPADAGVAATLSRYNAEGVTDAWDKAINRRKTDPEGAITSARTLLEEICKHILEDAGETPRDKWDLPKLYSETSKLMKLSPSQHTEDTFKRILGGCQSVVENLGGLRNKISDAHGGGRMKIRPTERHAALAVNLAGSMAMFLIETWEARQNEVATREARRDTKAKPMNYKDVPLASREDLAFEIEGMKRIVDVMARDTSRRLESIWCDSKACATYTITVRNGLWVDGLQDLVQDAVIKGGGGHNGIYFDGDTPVSAIDPYWPSDFDEFEK